MLILDENGNTVENPDLEKGQLAEKQRNVTHQWIVDVEEQSHEEVIAEYDNGGKDVETVIDVEEQGHWETRLENGETIDFDGIIPDDMPKELVLDDSQDYFLYVPYTEAELEEIEKQKAEAEAETEAEEEQQELIQALPDAVAELSETVSSNADEASSLSDAVAELSEIVSNLVGGVNNNG